MEVKLLREQVERNMTSFSNLKRLNCLRIVVRVPML